MNDEPTVPVIVWNTAELARAGAEALASGGSDSHPMVEGRIVAVHASPTLGTSRHMSAGVSALPAGLATPAHSHPAEEYAHVLRGNGSITIDGTVYPVREGDIVLTPANSVHVTTAGDCELVIWWIYGPAGSESRWLEARGEAPART